MLTTLEFYAALLGVIAAYGGFLLALNRCLDAHFKDPEEEEDAGAAEDTTETETLPAPEEELSWRPLVALFADDEDEGNEFCDDFTLDDIEPGVSVMGGYTTRGVWECGVVLGWKEGSHFYFDGSQEGSLLWNELVLLRGPIAKKAAERWRDRCEGNAPMKRTDSGTNYGFYGNPDLNFWEASGFHPRLYESPADYMGSSVGHSFTLDSITARLAELDDYVEGRELSPAQQRAADRQRSELEVLRDALVASAKMAEEGEIPQVKRGRTLRRRAHVP